MNIYHVVLILNCILLSIPNILSRLSIFYEKNSVLLILKFFQIFGPVQQIIKFKTLDEVIKRANDTKYGLASGILTKNMDTAMKYMDNVNAGSVW